MLEDELRYTDASPWPTAADGDGSSLQRISATSWGDNAASWIAASPTPGTAQVSALVGRYVFYNNSRYDGHTGYISGDPAINIFDDNAIATDKTALLPGHLATFANYTSYSRGINGIMVDIAGLANPGSISAADFQFQVGNGSALDCRPCSEQRFSAPGRWRRWFGPRDHHLGRQRHPKPMAASNGQGQRQHRAGRRRCILLWQCHRRVGRQSGQRRGGFPGRISLAHAQERHSHSAHHQSIRLQPRRPGKRDRRHYCPAQSDRRHRRQSIAIDFRAGERSAGGRRYIAAAIIVGRCRNSRSR